MPTDLPKPAGEGGASGPGGGLQGLLKNKWVLYGGIGLLALGVGWIALSGSAGNASAANTGTGYAPVDYGGYGGQTPVSGGSSGGSPDDLTAALQAALAGQQAQTQLGLTSLNDSLAAALAGDQTAIATSQIAGQVSNYAASTNVLDEYLKSAGPGIIGFGGQVAPTGSGGVMVGLFSDTQNHPEDWSKVLGGVAGQLGTPPPVTPIPTGLPPPPAPIPPTPPPPTGSGGQPPPVTPPPSS